MAALSVDIYKGVQKIGQGSINSSATSVTSYTANGGARALSRNVQISVTTAGTHVGRSWATRVDADNGSGTLTLRDACPFL